MAWRKDYAPHSPEEDFHPRFVEALQKQAQVEYLLDVLLFGETEDYFYSRGIVKNESDFATSLDNWEICSQW